MSPASSDRRAMVSRRVEDGDVHEIDWLLFVNRFNPTQLEMKQAELDHEASGPGESHIYSVAGLLFQQPASAAHGNENDVCFSETVSVLGCSLGQVVMKVVELAGNVPVSSDALAGGKALYRVMWNRIPVLEIEFKKGNIAGIASCALPDGMRNVEFEVPLPSFAIDLAETIDIRTRDICRGDDFVSAIQAWARDKDRREKLFGDK